MKTVYFQTSFLADLKFSRLKNSVTKEIQFIKNSNSLNRLFSFLSQITKLISNWYQMICTGLKNVKKNPEKINNHHIMIFPATKLRFTIAKTGIRGRCIIYTIDQVTSPI